MLGLAMRPCAVLAPAVLAPAVFARGVARVPLASGGRSVVLGPLTAVALVDRLVMVMTMVVQRPDRRRLAASRQIGRAHV